MSVNPFERKDRRGGGYAKRKYKEGGISQNQLARKYNVSQPIINMLIKQKTYIK